MKRRSDHALARALGAQARDLLARVADPSWDADAIQLVVAGLYGAQRLARSLGIPGLDRGIVLEVYATREGLLERSVRRACGPDATLVVSHAVDEILTQLNEGSADESGPSQPSLLTFYEPFLEAFDPALRRSRGVYFTPPELAAHVVARVDETLEHELGAEDGIACEVGAPLDVCVLDPAAGVGAFLTAVVDRMHARFDARCRARGMTDAAALEAWRRHVPVHVLPRVIGLEVMPAAHALACLQLRLALARTGYALGPHDRIEIHRADALASLERLDVPSSSSHALEHEPVSCALRRATVVVGNPPYARGGAVRSAFWQGLLEPYKAPIRGEKNLQPLADDYLRFLRFTEHLLSSKPVAVSGLITSSTFASGHLHRGVRASLLRSFPRIDVLDLGGSTKRSSRDAARERDENVFGVAQGIAFTLMRRVPGSCEPVVRFASLRGRRVDKLAKLHDASRVATTFIPEAPLHLLVPSEPVPPEYTAFVALDALFAWSSIAAKPGDDALLVAFEPDGLAQRVQALREKARRDPALARTEAARRVRDFEGAIEDAHVTRFAYRPFDTRFVYGDARLWTRPVHKLRDRLDGEPLLLSTRIAQDGDFAHVFAVECLPDVIFLSNKSSVNCFAFPRSALRVETVNDRLGTQVDASGAFAYVYAVLHATRYRKRYAVALARDFARVPITSDLALFQALASHGHGLLALHLAHVAPPRDERMRFVPAVDRRIEARALSRVDEGTGSSTAETLRISINRDCRFEGVDRAAWKLRVGGYQVCHKWLLDRARAGLEMNDTCAESFGRVVDAARETVRIVRVIDACIEDAGGFPKAFVARA